MKLPTWNARGAHIDVDLLSSYLDGQVTPNEQANVEQHLRVCASCQAELRSLRQTVTMVRALPRVPVPRAFTLSEVQVGIRRPSTPVPWFGGLVRVGAALTAVAVVAVLGVVLLRNPALSPGSPVARVAVTATSQPVANSPVAPAAQLETRQAPARAATVAPVPTNAQSQPKAAEIAPTAATAAQRQPKAATQSAPEASPAPAGTRSNTADQAPAPTRPQQASAAAPAAKAAVTQPASPVPSVTPEPALALAAPAAPQPEAAGVSSFGRGGGGGQPYTPQAAPPAAPITTTLPAGAGIVYADGQTVFALDNEKGARELIKAPGVFMPLVSPDRAWIAYRVMGPEYTELRAVRWDGSAAHKLLSEQDLPKDDLGSSYSERRFVQQDLRWVPGTHTLAVRILASPIGSDTAAKDELWNLDADSGKFRRVLDLGTTGYFVYSPDGKRIALLQRGNPAQPEGNLYIFNADGNGKHKALEFPANAFGYGYESQISWLPDSQGLLIAIPDAEAEFGVRAAGITLYRAPVGGEAQQNGRIEATSTYWSPDGKRLVYTQPGGDAMGNLEVMLANADGSNPQIYVTVINGLFAGWSPDSKHFVYQNDGQSFVGAPGQAPVAVPGLMEIMQARWVAPGQIVYPWNEGESWSLVSDSLDGKPVTLAPTGQAMTYDVVPAR